MSDSSDNSPPRRKHKPYEELSREFKKIKPPAFNGEMEKREEVEARLSGMKMNFHIYTYSNKLKARMAIYIILLVRTIFGGKMLRKLRT